MNSSFGPFLVIVLGLLLGFAFRRNGRFSPDAPRALNAYVIAIALPAVVLSQLPRFLRGLSAQKNAIEPALFFLPFIPWLIFFAAIPFFRTLYKRKWIRRDQWGLLVLAAGLGNTSFVGIPLLEALMGPQHIPMAILLDQLGTFLALSVGGTFWISYFHSTNGDARRFSWKRFLGELVRFPPFVALLAAFVLAGTGELPEILQGALERFAATLVPVAMISVGAQLKPELKMFQQEGRGLFWGLGYKMALAPFMIAALGYGVFGFRGDAIHLGVLEAAMAPMITSTVLGIEAGFAPNLGALILGIGIPLSLATLPVLHWVLLRFGF